MTTGGTMHRPERRTKTRRALIVVLIAAALAGAVLARGSRGQMSAHYHVDTTAGRVAYLNDLGWSVDPATEDVREDVVPSAFDRTLTAYNTLQRAQGFDLLPYAGRAITVVTYAVAGEPETLVTLWICGGVVIAGDVHTAAMDGSMRGILPTDDP